MYVVTDFLKIYSTNVWIPAVCQLTCCVSLAHGREYRQNPCSNETYILNNMRKYIFYRFTKLFKISE